MGDVSRWDQARSAWLPMHPAELPFFMARPKFASLKTPAIWLYITFGIFAAFIALHVAADIWRLVLLDRLLSGKIVDIATADASDDLYSTALGFQIFASIPLPFLFIWWMRRAYCNLESLGSTGADYSAGWAVGSWFVPILAWFRPFQILNQVWKGSDPTLPPDRSREWRSARGSKLLLAWWIMYIVGNFAWFLTFAVSGDDQSLEDLQDASVAVLLFDFLTGVSVGLAIAIVARLTARQEEANRRLDLPAGHLEVPV